MIHLTVDERALLAEDGETILQVATRNHIEIPTLCYLEDVAATVDFNLVMNSAGEFIELQASGEEATFSESQLAEMLRLGKTGLKELHQIQQAALGN